MANENYTKVNVQQLSDLASTIQRSKSEIESGLTNYKNLLQSIQSSGYLEGISIQAINDSYSKIITTYEKFANYALGVISQLTGISEETQNIDQTQASGWEEIMGADPLNFGATLGTLGAAAGTIASAMGTLASEVAPVLGQVASDVAPVIGEVVSDVAPAIGDLTKQAASTLGSALEASQAKNQNSTGNSGQTGGGSSGGSSSGTSSKGNNSNSDNNYDQNNDTNSNDSTNTDNNSNMDNSQLPSQQQPQTNEQINDNSNTSLENTEGEGTINSENNQSSTDDTPESYPTVERSTSVANGSELTNAQIESRSEMVSYAKKEMGLNEAATAALLANADQESAFNPNTLNSESTGNMNYGLAQWSGPRRASLVNYCDQNGYDYTTTEGQMRFMEYELETSYPELYEKLKNVENTPQGASEAATYFYENYNIPSSANPMLEQRSTNAMTYYSELMN